MAVSKKKRHGKSKKGKKKAPQGFPKKEPPKQTELISNEDTPENRILKIGIDIGRQQIVDMLCLVLNNKEIMRKDVFGKGRIQTVVQGINHFLGDVYTVAWGQEDESYYQRKRLDDNLLEILGPELFCPFQERYDHVKECEL